MTANLRKLLLVATLLLVSAPAVQAEDRAMVLGAGIPSRLALDSVFASVIIGDPLIVEVRIDDDRSVVIEPLKPGATNLVFVDAHGRVIANVRISVCDPSGPDACDAAAGRT
jgi:Flp pilus assembly secretin CpaC